LRLDGIYGERGSSIGYWITQGSSFNFNEGTASFWVKPNFYPEGTGKPRAFLSMARYHNANPQTINPSPFTLFFFPAHDAAAGSMSAYENPAIPSYYGGIGKFRPASLGFGIGFHSTTGYNWELSGNPNDFASLHANVLTPTLNHELHGSDNGDRLIGDDGKSNWLRGHEWTHLAVTWKFTPGVLHDANSVQIYVNGQVLPGTVGIPSYYGAAAGEPASSFPLWDLHALQVNVPGYGSKWANNSIRIGGEISKLLDEVWGTAGSILPRNYSADATFDEFYLWNNRSTGGLTGAQTLWYRGRYYKPADANPDDAVFTSAPLTLSPSSRRVPPSTTIPCPDGTQPSLLNALPSSVKKRVVGISWTSYAEDYDQSGTTMRPKMYDYSSWPPLELYPGNESTADLWMIVDGVTYGPYQEEGFSSVQNTKGDPVPVMAEARYRAKLKMGPKSPSTILLASPVLDDVTIFFDLGQPEMIGWVLINS
jgi:hypothetical protein